VKYAMNEMLTHPPKEFEEVIRTHFLLNRENILKTVDKWVEESKSRTASYGGLVTSHNYDSANKFSTKSDGY